MVQVVLEKAIYWQEYATMLVNPGLAWPSPCSQQSNLLRISCKPCTEVVCLAFGEVAEQLIY
jgi:hypothetical protein